MTSILGLIICFCWGMFAAAMGHVVFYSLGDTLVVILPCFAFGPAIRCWSREFSGGNNALR